MRIGYLITYLPEGMLKKAILRDPDADIAETVLLPAPEDVLEDDVLYVADTAPDPCPKNLASPSGPAENQLIPAPGVTPEQLSLELRRILRRNRRTVVSSQDLTRFFLTGCTLQEFIDEAARCMGNPLDIIDTSFRYVARSAARQEKSRVPEEYISEQGRAYIRRAKLDDLLSSGQALQRYNEQLGCDTLTILLRVHGIEIGYLMLRAEDRPIRPGDSSFFTLIAGMAGQQLQKSELFRSSEAAASWFLADLLEELHPSEDRIARRLDALSFQPQGEFFAAVIDRPNHDLPEQTTCSLDWRLGSLLSGSIRTVHDGQLVLLVTGAKGAGRREEVCRALQPLAQEGGLAVGVSCCFTALSEIRRFYRQACKALQLGLSHPKPCPLYPVFAYEDYSLIEMIQVCREHAELMDFCHPALLRLLDYDRKNHSDLMNTLYEYLRAGCSTQAAAAALFIHKNTLLYRLDRIREVLDCDLSDNWQRLLLEISYRILFESGAYLTPRIRASLGSAGTGPVQE